MEWRGEGWDWEITWGGLEGRKVDSEREGDVWWQAGGEEESEGRSSEIFAKGGSGE